MRRCVACKKTIWPWQKTGFNLYWHNVCTEIFKKGYDKAMAFCDIENSLMGYKRPKDLYLDRMMKPMKSVTPIIET